MRKAGKKKDKTTRPEKRQTNDDRASKTEAPEDDSSIDYANYTQNSIGEKRYYRKDEIDEQDSDGSANAFDGK